MKDRAVCFRLRAVLSPAGAARPRIPLAPAAVRPRAFSGEEMHRLRPDTKRCDLAFKNGHLPLMGAGVLPPGPFGL